MKKYLLSTAFLAIFLLVTIRLTAQISISTDNSPADNSAMLDVKSNSKGVLLPRMTSAEMNAIVNPASGLLVYCTDCVSSNSGSLTIFLNGTWNTVNITTCSLAPPVAGLHTCSSGQIVWKWNTISGAIGYKWNTTNDYATATDMGTNTSKTETGLTTGTTYTRFVWAYGNCGKSTATTLNQLLVYIGISYGGGIIFYIDGTGQHGLISATSDQSTSAFWGCAGGVTSTDIGTGQANTTSIVNNCNTTGFAARICDDLVLNDYSDWFLPSKDELYLMYCKMFVIGGFTSNYYWSSSGNSSDAAWCEKFFDTGGQYSYSKSLTLYVRAVRAF